MTTDNLITEQKNVYTEYRTAKRNLKKGRDFFDWMKIARGYDFARRAAMRAAGTNNPQGAAYREEFARIDRRERLIDRDDQGREFPSKEDRTYCIKVIENYDAPSYDPRRPSIKAWRDALPETERAKVNHPKRIWTAYQADTEPRAEKIAKRVERAAKGPKENPHIEALADSEVREHEARRQIEALRELLGLIRDAIDLPEDIVAKIDAALRG